MSRSKMTEFMGNPTVLPHVRLVRGKVVVKKAGAKGTTLEVLRELLAAVTSKGAIDTTQPIMWSGSPEQNRRMYAAIEAAKKEVRP